MTKTIIKNKRKASIKLEYSGTVAQLLQRPDTFTARHIEAGIVIWRWVMDAVRTVSIHPVINPILNHSRSAVGVYRDLVNCIVYRKPHHKVRFHHNGVSRCNDGARCLKNYCPDCSDAVVDKKNKVMRVTRGVYLPIEHQCNSVRVYDLAGKLLEVKTLC